MRIDHSSDADIMIRLIHFKGFLHSLKFKIGSQMMVQHLDRTSVDICKAS